MHTFHFFDLWPSFFVLSKCHNFQWKRKISLWWCVQDFSSHLSPKYNLVFNVYTNTHTHTHTHIWKHSFSKQIVHGCAIQSFILVQFLHYFSPEVMTDKATLSFFRCLDLHSDGTHFLQRIHWWAAMLNFSKSVLMIKQTHLHLRWPEGECVFS